MNTALWIAVDAAIFCAIVAVVTDSKKKEKK